jgi:hypothetical protein
MNETLRVVLAVLAVFRVAHLIAREDGPWSALARLRQAAGTGVAGQVLRCFYCLSLWIAFPFVWYLTGNWMEKVVGWFAISGGAILLERFGHEPLEVKIEEGAGDGMLR